MTREEEIAYAKEHDIPVSPESAYSIDENLWGRSIECGVLEDPWAEPPEEVFAWTRAPQDAPDQPAYVEIGFERGVPVSLNAKEIDGGEFYAQLKGPTRVRDMTTGELRYVWQETSGLVHYRHAHAYDHLAGVEFVVPKISVIV